MPSCSHLIVGEDSCKNCTLLDLKSAFLLPPKGSGAENPPILKIGNHSFSKCCLQISRTGIAFVSRIVQLVHVQEVEFGVNCFQYTKSLNLASGWEGRA